jgi:ribosomal protein S18 acetylase RimI-like enzyme
MIIRKADLRDLNDCVALDTTYATEHVWQVRTEERPYEEVLITLHTIKLARGWVKDLAVVTPYRRQGIGSELVRAALRWGRERALRSVLAETQTKNYPAICFCRKHGFVFCGFIDQYYPNQDIAVFFARGL